ncbi:MAG: hypothetical protein LBN25_00785 [Christensenellaceae bacterium]|jgi:hypothetical protein|nr:hypothetical protein [Christensenellaceae bacterium]
MFFGDTSDIPGAINYQKVIANLFGVASAETFIQNAKNLKTAYDTYKAAQAAYGTAYATYIESQDYKDYLAALVVYDNTVDKSDIERPVPPVAPIAPSQAYLNGCFVTTNGSFVFPVAVHNSLADTVLMYVVLDNSGLVSVWVNNIRAALTATNSYSPYTTGTTVDNYLYCKNMLFVNGGYDGQWILTSDFQSALPSARIVLNDNPITRDIIDEDGVTHLGNNLKLYGEYTASEQSAAAFGLYINGASYEIDDGVFKNLVGYNNGTNVLRVAKAVGKETNKLTGSIALVIQLNSIDALPNARAIYDIYAWYVPGTDDGHVWNNITRETEWVVDEGEEGGGHFEDVKMWIPDVGEEGGGHWVFVENNASKQWVGTLEILPTKLVITQGTDPEKIVYNGDAVSVTEGTNFTIGGLSDDTLSLYTVSVQYRLANSGDAAAAEWTTTPPVRAGQYDVKVTVDPQGLGAANNPNYKLTEETFFAVITIEKANVFDQVYVDLSSYQVKQRTIEGDVIQDYIAYTYDGRGHGVSIGNIFNTVSNQPFVGFDLAASMGGYFTISFRRLDEYGNPSGNIFSAMPVDSGSYIVILTYIEGQKTNEGYSDCYGNKDGSDPLVKYYYYKSGSGFDTTYYGFIEIEKRTPDYALSGNPLLKVAYKGEPKIVPTAVANDITGVRIPNTIIQYAYRVAKNDPLAAPNPWIPISGVPGNPIEVGVYEIGVRALSFTNPNYKEDRYTGNQYELLYDSTQSPVRFTIEPAKPLISISSSIYTFGVDDNVTKEKVFEKLITVYGVNGAIDPSLVDYNIFYRKYAALNADWQVLTDGVSVGAGTYDLKIEVSIIGKEVVNGETVYHYYDTHYQTEVTATALQRFRKESVPLSFSFTATEYIFSYDGLGKALTSANLTLSLGDKILGNPNGFTFYYRAKGTTEYTLNPPVNILASGGLYDVRVVYTASANDYFGDSETFSTIRIIPVSITVNASAGEKVYNGKPIVINGVTAFPGSDTSYTAGDLSFSLSKEITNTIRLYGSPALIGSEGNYLPGTYIISKGSLSFINPDGLPNYNYQLTFQGASYVIHKMGVEFVWSGLFEKEYNGEEISIVSSLSNIAQGDNVSTTITYEIWKQNSVTGMYSWVSLDGAPIEVSKYRVTAVIAGRDQGNYIILHEGEAQREIVIRKASFSINKDNVAPDLTFNYFGTAVQYQVNTDGLAAGVNFEYSTDGGNTFVTVAPLYKNVGLYSLQIRITRPNNLGDSNYYPVIINTKIVIERGDYRNADGTGFIAPEYIVKGGLNTLKAESDGRAWAFTIEEKRYLVGNRLPEITVLYEKLDGMLYFNDYQLLRDGSGEAAYLYKWTFIPYDTGYYTITGTIPIDAFKRQIGIDYGKDIVQSLSPSRAVTVKSVDNAEVYAEEIMFKIAYEIGISIDNLTIEWYDESGKLIGRKAATAASVDGMINATGISTTSGVKTATYKYVIIYAGNENVTAFVQEGYVIVKGRVDLLAIYIGVAVAGLLIIVSIMVVANRRRA